MYLVIQCYVCGGYLIADDKQRTRHCPYCNHRILLEKTKKVLYRRTIKEASEALRAVKMNDFKKRLIK